MSTDKKLKALVDKIECYRIQKGMIETELTSMSSATYNRFKRGKSVGLDKFVSLVDEMGFFKHLIDGIPDSSNNVKTRKRASKVIPDVSVDDYVSVLDDPRVTLKIALTWQDQAYSDDFSDKVAKKLNSESIDDFTWNASDLGKRMEQVLILSSMHEGMYLMNNEFDALFKMALRKDRLSKTHNPINKERIMAEDFLKYHSANMYKLFGLIEEENKQVIKTKISIMANMVSWFGTNVGGYLYDSVTEKEKTMLDAQRQRYLNGK